MNGHNQRLPPVVDTDLLFCYSGKTDNDPDMPAVIRNVDGGIEHFDGFGDIIVLRVHGCTLVRFIIIALFWKNFFYISYIPERTFIILTPR